MYCSRSSPQNELSSLIILLSSGSISKHSLHYCSVLYTRGFLRDQQKRKLMTREMYQLV
jgi:hypothetical protein